MNKVKKIKKSDLFGNLSITELFDVYNGDNKNSGIPKIGNGTYTVTSTDSSEKKEKYGMNQLDKLGYLRMQNVMLDRSGILRENEGINNFKQENPDLFLKINLFVSDLKNFNIDDNNKKFVIDYIENKIQTI